MEPIDDRAHEIWTARPLQTSHLSQRRWIQNFPWQSSDLARRPAGEHGRQLGDTHRLGEVIVHATLEAALSIGRHGAGGQSNDRHRLSAVERLTPPERFGHLVAVHLWHLAVQQDRRVRSLLHGDSYRAEDIVQETLLRAWLHAANEAPDWEPGRAWLRAALPES